MLVLIVVRRLEKCSDFMRSLNTSFFIKYMAYKSCLSNMVYINSMNLVFDEIRGSLMI